MYSGYLVFNVCEVIIRGLVGQSASRMRECWRTSLGDRHPKRDGDLMPLMSDYRWCWADSVGPLTLREGSDEGRERGREVEGGREG
jgi:hypothetical protein